jgi:hypothetical protein
MAASSPHSYVASDEASFTNGVDLVVDGGQTEL